MVARNHMAVGEIGIRQVTGGEIQPLCTGLYLEFHKLKNRVKNGFEQVLLHHSLISAAS